MNYTDFIIQETVKLLASTAPPAIPTTQLISS